MVFNEIYSAYYNAVACIISEILNGNTDAKALSSICTEKAFGESFVAIMQSVKEERWQIIKKDFTTPIKHIPTMPLTDLQKMYLASIFRDKRIKLFGIEPEFLKDVEPLFTDEDYYVFDKYSDGDNFEDEGYISIFRTILKAMNENKCIKIEMIKKDGSTLYARCNPEKLEYSEKDDKFRLVTSGCPFVSTVNLSRIKKCRLYDGEQIHDAATREQIAETVVLRIKDERNALERALLHFAHFEKKCERAEEDKYLLYVNYCKEDETELVIRVLSFGPMLEVVESNNFRNLIKERLEKQICCGL